MALVDGLYQITPSLVDRFDDVDSLLLICS